MAVIWLLMGVSAAIGAGDLYVATTGDDTNAGTQQAPLASIAAARDAIRAMKEDKGLPAGGVTVWLRGGHYAELSSVSFDERDGGTAESPIVFRPMAGEKVYLDGGYTLDPTWFALVTRDSPVWSRIDPSARGKVYQVTLPDHQITDYGRIQQVGFDINVPAPLELFFQGQAMTLARWPNEDQPMAYTVTAPSKLEFTYAGDRPHRWAQAKDIWLHGFWNTTWADFTAQVGWIDEKSRTISFEVPPAQFGTGPKRPYFAFNLLEELDEPGEYYLDRETGILYFWPPEPLKGANLQASMLEDSLLKIDGASYLTFEGLTIEDTRGPLVAISGGSHILVQDCVLRNCGEFGIQILGSNNGLNHCDVSECGCDGVRLGGGARASLTPGGNFVTNCRIHHIARLGWTEHPAINFLDGCGNLASHNLIDEVPHMAVLIVGNNQVIEYNEIRRACLLTSDSGVIYTGRDWGYRGNVIRYNFIHHIQSNQAGNGVQGVYLDDLVSGVKVFGNVFYKIKDAAIFCGGGRDNLIENNVIANCGIGHYNSDYARSHVTNDSGSSWNLLERLTADGIEYQKDPWKTAYPTLAAIPDSFAVIETGLWRNPQGTVFADNVGWGNARWMEESNLSKTGVFAVYASIANNIPNQAPLFDESASLDRRKRPATLIATVPGFQPIPFAAIGPALESTGPATEPPARPRLTVSLAAATTAELTWTSPGPLSTDPAAGFELQRADAAGGAWKALLTLGSEAAFAPIAGLSPAQTYFFRVRAFNAAGSVLSNEAQVTTETPIVSAGPPVRFEAETAMTAVLANHGNKGKVGVISSKLASGKKAVSLFNIGDSVRITFTVPIAGLYRLGVRVRSGDANLPIGTSYWPEGYDFVLDGAPLKLRGDETTLSAIDNSYGTAYWGTMRSDSLTLTAGIHSLDVTSGNVWAMLDYVEVEPLATPGRP